MTDPIREFEAECEVAGFAPSAAFKAAGMNPSTWFRWKSGASSPTLRSLEAVRKGLAKLTDTKPHGGASVSLESAGGSQ